jgi:hypothetical protein
VDVSGEAFTSGDGDGEGLEVSCAKADPANSVHVSPIKNILVNLVLSTFKFLTRLVLQVDPLN